MKPNLREEQQRMLSLLKNEAELNSDETDPLFFNKLKFQKKIIVWWRCFQFEHWLILTSKILKHENLFESLVSDLYKEKNVSSYPSEAGEEFVNHILNQSLNPTIKSIASLELALIKLKDEENKEEYRIFWSQSPIRLLGALLNGNEYSLADNDGKYEMIVSNQISGKMVVYELN